MTRGKSASGRGQSMQSCWSAPNMALIGITRGTVFVVLHFKKKGGSFRSALGVLMLWRQQIKLGVIEPLLGHED